MKAGSLPGGPWEKLFPRALIDEISRYGGIQVRSGPWAVELC